MGGGIRGARSGVPCCPAGAGAGYCGLNAIRCTPGSHSDLLDGDFGSIQTDNPRHSTAAADSRGVDGCGIGGARRKLGIDTDSRTGNLLVLGDRQPPETCFKRSITAGTSQTRSATAVDVMRLALTTTGAS